jgi:putative membrane protein
LWGAVWHVEEQAGVELLLLAQTTESAAEGVARGASLPGFIPGARGSLMLDVVFLAMFLVVPVLLFSVYQVKYRGQFQLHKQLQLILGTVLLLAVGAFEVDMRFFTDWKVLAGPSPFFDRANPWSCPVGISLIVHLSFAIPTLVLWIVVIVQALRHFPSPPVPGAHSGWHRRWGMMATVSMVLTAVTGWIYYYLAFVATA